MLIDGASASRPLITVEPVVVRPDAASKKASVKDMPRPSSISGSAPTAGSSVQASTTSMMPSRIRISRRKRRVASHRPRPPTKHTAALVMKPGMPSSRRTSASTSGTSIVMLNTITTAASTLTIG